jgi:Lon protease-like protein
MTETLPIFALGTVLFPGGVLPLRVFEARYVDMVRRVMRDDGTFGVCLIRSGHEVGKHEIDVEPIGCRARIENWNMEQLGVLEIVAVGTERFEIVSTHVAADGLLVAEVLDVEPEPPVARGDEQGPSWTIIGRIVADLDARTGDDGAAMPMIAKPYRLDDATWVGNRLSELLPLPGPVRQKLMVLNDARARLTVLDDFLAQHGVV